MDNPISPDETFTYRLEETGEICCWDCMYTVCPIDRNALAIVDVKYVDADICTVCGKTENVRKVVSICFKISKTTKAFRKFIIDKTYKYGIECVRKRLRERWNNAQPSEHPSIGD